MELVDLGEFSVDHLLRQVLPLNQEHVHIVLAGDEAFLEAQEGDVANEGAGLAPAARNSVVPG